MSSKKRARDRRNWGETLMPEIIKTVLPILLAVELTTSYFSEPNKVFKYDY
jgi:hypothetical protein